jgi:RNA polymerase sigma factor (sigma-70 family)
MYLPPPDAETWADIAALYNSQRQQLAVPGVALSGSQIEAQMTKLGQWIRAYLYPAIDSLNRSKPDAGSGEMQDDLTDPASESLLDTAIEQEEIERRTSQQIQLQTALTQALENLSQEFQEVLILFYRDGLSQQEIAVRIDSSQATVSRRLKKAEEHLLNALLAWIESQLHKFPDPNELKIIGTTLKEWLLSHFQPDPA